MRGFAVLLGLVGSALNAGCAADEQTEPRLPCFSTLGRDESVVVTFEYSGCWKRGFYRFELDGSRARLIEAQILECLRDDGPHEGSVMAPVDAGELGHLDVELAERRESTIDALPTSSERTLLEWKRSGEVWHRESVGMILTDGSWRKRVPFDLWDLIGRANDLHHGSER